MHGVNFQVFLGGPGQTHLRVRGAADVDPRNRVWVAAVLDPVHHDSEHVEYAPVHSVLYMKLIF